MMTFIGIVLLAAVPGWGNAPPTGVVDCDIAGVYQKVIPDPGTLALTTLGEAEEVEALLVPARVETGRYRVSVSRRGSDLYEANGTSMFFRTRYCYEYAAYQTVVVEITSSAGFTRGSIDFDPNS